MWSPFPLLGALWAVTISFWPCTNQSIRQGAHKAYNYGAKKKCNEPTFQIVHQAGLVSPAAPPGHCGHRRVKNTWAGCRGTCSGFEEKHSTREQTGNDARNARPAGHSRSRVTEPRRDLENFIKQCLQRTSGALDTTTGVVLFWRPTGRS